MYAVVLVTKDTAGNAQVARRFLIFDNVNDISISSDEDKQLLVLSAAENTSHTWLTSLQAGDGVGDQVRRKQHGYLWQVRGEDIDNRERKGREW